MHAVHAMMLCYMMLALQNMGVRATGVGMVAAALCPMHGPVVRASVTELVGQYRQVSTLFSP